MRVAVVTGGASGIGRAVAHHFAGLGDAVALLDIDADGTERVVKELEAANAPRVLGCPADVKDRVQVDQAMDRVRAELGPVGILVTCAAVAPMFETFAETTAESWDLIIGTNLTGTFHCVQSAVPDMVAAGWGRVVLFSSASAQLGAPGMAHYAASKGGIIALTRTLAIEYAPSAVTVNAIAPLVVDTPSVHRKQAAGRLPASDVLGSRLPLRRIGTGDDIASACVFLCSDGASYITGQTISVNGGGYFG